MARVQPRRLLFVGTCLLYSYLWTNVGSIRVGSWARLTLTLVLVVGRALPSPVLSAIRRVLAVVMKDELRAAQLLLPGPDLHESEFANQVQ